MRMIDIARAADVAEQTLYNYFPTKEHLIFDMDQEFEAESLLLCFAEILTSLADALRWGNDIFERGKPFHWKVRLECQRR